jgi:hypothetical protein
MLVLRSCRLPWEAGRTAPELSRGQEDQLGALGLVLNMFVLWNTFYIDAALNKLGTEGYPVKDEDAYRLSPLQHENINMLGRLPRLLHAPGGGRGLLTPKRSPEKHRSPRLKVRK